jgi:hypothetical protein
VRSGPTPNAFAAAWAYASTASPDVRRLPLSAAMDQRPVCRDRRVRSE